MKVQQGIKKARALFVMLVVMVVILIPQIAQAAVDLSPEGIYNAMIAKKSDYPEGMPWTDSNTYNWYAFKEYTVYYTGGCAAFAAILSDAAFGDLAARQLPEKMYDAIRPGDILRINNDSHSVIVLRKFNDYVEVAEGNYNSSIHWGRTISKETLIGTTATPGTLTYIITRYPTDPIQHNYEVSSLVENTVTLRCSDCGLERILTMPGSDVSLFFTEDGTHYKNPSKLSMMPDDTISLGLFIYSGGYLSLPSFDAETVECTISDGDVAVFSNGETTIQGRTATIKAVGGGTATLTVRSIYDDRVMFTKSIEVGGVQTLKGTPGIVGDLKYGATLTPSVTNTNNTGTLTYDWQRSDGDGYRVWIASGPQYTLTKEDIGYYIELVVKSTVEEGYLFQATSQVIQKADGPAAPTGLVGIAPTKKGDSDGKIQGVNASMEYATNKSFSDAKSCTAGELTGLAAGTYYVRIAETDTTKAGTEVSVDVPEGSEVIADPSITIDSAAAKLDGTIGLRFYYLIPEELFNGESYALMEINGRSVKQKFSQAAYDPTSG
ncbi:MAG: hypothetical protein E7295_17175, partial [Lachnospiraceae bacterium]|nr:hypothetical protein [Lachnospiraceae bacterium]